VFDRQMYEQNFLRNTIRCITCSRKVCNGSKQICMNTSKQMSFLGRDEITTHIALKCYRTFLPNITVSLGNVTKNHLHNKVTIRVPLSFHDSLTTEHHIKLGDIQCTIGV